MNKMKLKTIVLLLMMGICSTTISAHYYNNVRVRDNSPIHCVVQDETNLVWLGTEHGLYLYDGYRCIPRHTAGERLRSTIYCMDSKNGLLFLGTPEGLLIYNAQDDNCFRPEQSLSEGRALIVSDHQVMIGSPEGLWEYQIKDKTFRLEDSTVKDIYTLLETENGLLMGTLKGLYLRKDGETKLLEIRKGNEPFINSLLADRQRGCVWVGAGDMLYRYDLKTGEIRETPHLKGASVKSMALTEDNTLFVATDNGLYTFTKDVWSLDTHDARHPHSLADNVVWCVFIDHCKNVILGTDGGLSVIPYSSYYRYQPINMLTQMGDGNKLATLLIDSQGRKWLGGSNGLILQDNGATTWFRQTDPMHPISHNRIRRLYEDKDRHIWIATDNGLNLYDQSSERMRNIIVTDSSGHYSARWVYDVSEDDKGRMWIATYGGVYIIAKSRLVNAMGFVSADNYLGEGQLDGQWASQLVKDGKGNVWVRTDGGLECYDINTLSSKTLKKGMPGYLMSDRQGNIWEADDTVLCCYVDGNIVKRYDLGYNQPTKAVSMCEIDRQIWVITSKECILIGEDGPELRLRIPVVEAYGACYAEKEKCLYIGGADGLTSMYPAEVKSSRINRKLMLTNLLVNDEQRLYNGQSIRLPHNKNSIEIWLSDLPYTGDISVSYAYQLSGVDDTWHLMESVSEPLVYSSLPIGDYVLKIRTIDGSGQEGHEVFSADICILPPWYWSWWAKIIYALMLVAFAFGLNRFYMIRKRLVREQREKQRILEQTRMRMDFYTSMSRSLKGALQQVMMPLSEMIANSKDKEQVNMVSAVRSQTTLMNALIRKAFDVGEIREQSNVKLSKIHLVRFMNETMDGLKTVLVPQNISVRLVTESKDIFMHTDVLLMDSVISMLVQYIAMNTAYNGYLSIYMNTHSYSGKVLININSDLMNIPNNELAYLFQHYGDDLYIVKEYVEELGGKIMVESEDMRGTTFSLVFDAMTYDVNATPSMNSEEALNDLTTVIPKEEEVISEKDEKLMREITAAIEDHLIDSDFNVTMLQEIVGIGQKLLYRKVKQIAGVTPVEYIRNIRMEKSARLLREGKFSVSEVMYMVGFTKSGYFSKCFQETFGMTPSAYIKQSNNQ